MRRLSHNSSSQAPPSPNTLSSFTIPPSTKPALSGQVALITGATGGIGAATARLLASHGCSVALHYNSDQDGALALQDEFKEAYVRNFGSKFVAYKADLEDWDEVGFLFPSQSTPYKDKRSVLGRVVDVQRRSANSTNTLFRSSDPPRSSSTTPARPTA
jgi:hypothetical protein